MPAAAVAAAAARAIPWAVRLLRGAYKMGPTVGRAAGLGVRGLNYAKAHPFKSAMTVGSHAMGGLFTAQMASSLFGGDGDGEDAESMRDFYLEKIRHDEAPMAREEAREWMMEGALGDMRTAPYHNPNAESDAREAALSELVQRNAVRLAGASQTQSGRPDIMELAMRMGYK